MSRPLSGGYPIGYAWWSDEYQDALVARGSIQPCVRLELDGQVVTLGVTTVTPTPDLPTADAVWICFGRGAVVGARKAVW